MSRLDTPYTITDFTAHIAARIEDHAARVAREEAEIDRRIDASIASVSDEEVRDFRRKKAARAQEKSDALRARRAALVAQRKAKASRPRAVFTERQRLVRGLLEQHPDWTNHRIAAACDMSPPAVARVRRRLIRNGQVPDCDARNSGRPGVCPDGTVHPQMSIPSELAARLRRGNWPTNYDLDAAYHLDRIEGLEAEITRLRSERDRLIESWPVAADIVQSRPISYVYQNRFNELWYLSDAIYTGYPTKAAAVRAKAGLDGEGGGT